jgi:hypothetical protein
VTQKELESFALSESVLDGFSIECHKGGFDDQPCDGHIGQQGEAVLGGKFLGGEQAVECAVSTVLIQAYRS